MAGRISIPGRVLWMPAAISAVALFAPRSGAQERPLPSTPPAHAETMLAPGSLPEIGRVQGGWTADDVGARARKTSFDVAAKAASLRATEARVASAVVAFFPRLSGLASYTRYQDLTQPSLGTLVEPTNPALTGPIGPTTPLSAVPLSFTIPLNYWVFQATLTVPLSDYVLRITQQHAAARRNAEAAQSDVLATEAKAYSDAKIAFYQYVKAVAQRDVLVQSKAVADAHLVDATNLFHVGRGSNADVLATEANVAAARLAIDQATELVGVSEEQLRLATHAPPTEPVSIGEDVTSALPPRENDLPALFQEAAANRPEIRSLSLGALAQDKLASSARAAQWPSVSAIADYAYDNPSPRIFLPEAEFHGYWDAGVRITWALNDVFSGAAAGAEQQAGAANLRAQGAQVRDAVLSEVTSAVLAGRTADSSIDSSSAQLRSAEAAYDARRDLFRLGKGTSVELADAEADLFRARLAAISARIDQRITRVRIDHATGRDVARKSS